MPWWLKIAAKVVLSRLPLSYATFARLGAFKHGHMADPSYGLALVQNHMKRAGQEDLTGLVCLELGPGDSLLSALVVRAYGAKAMHLVDAGHFALTDVTVYRDLADTLAKDGLDISLGTATYIHQMMDELYASYATEGLSSLRAIATDSVDFMWSHAVLEHVRYDEVDATFAELRRILKPGGVASHRVDLQDHLDASLNNLRFSHTTWEQDWFANSGFYTNRIRYSSMCKRLVDAGFEITAQSADLFETLPIARSKLDPEFSDLSDEELKVRGFDVILN